MCMGCAYPARRPAARGPPRASVRADRDLEGAGVRVVAAQSAAQALALAAQGHFDAMISDIGIPHTDGYSFMRSLRQQNPSIPSLAVTAYARREDAEMAHRAGFTQHLVKPVEGAGLLATLHEMLAARSRAAVW